MSFCKTTFRYDEKDNAGKFLPILQHNAQIFIPKGTDFIKTSFDLE